MIIATLESGFRRIFMIEPLYLIPMIRPIAVKLPPNRFTGQIYCKVYTVNRAAQFEAAANYDNGHLGIINSF